jgi:hypothetical protein
MLKVLRFAGVILLSTTAAYAQSDPSAFLSKVNKDNDKTLSMHELNAYAARKFVELNTRGSKSLFHASLSRTELGDRISDSDFEKANTGHRKDETLSRSEFINYADLLFEKANRRGDKTLSVDELGSPAGRKLMKLLH